MSNKIAIESLSMDLMRVALGYHRGSIKMARRFSKEAQKRINEIERKNLKPYFIKRLDTIKKLLFNMDETGKAEDLLMYSIICKNYSQKFL